MKEIRGAAKIDRELRVRPGDKFEVPCEVKGGWFSHERTVIVRAEGLNEPAVTLVGKDAIREREGQHFIPVVVMDFNYEGIGEDTAVVCFPGEIQSNHSNLVHLSRRWLVVNGHHVKQSA